MNEGIRRKRGLGTKQGRVQLESLRLPAWTSRRRQELLELLDRFDPSIDQLSPAIEHQAEQQPEVQRLMTHPGVGPITALAFVLVLGTPQRFGCGKQVASYLESRHSVRPNHLFDPNFDHDYLMQTPS